jgi:hypothetical protein
VSSYNLNDLKIVDPLAYVRKRPDFWFTSGEFDAIEMASRLVSEVLYSGSSTVSVHVVDGWTIVSCPSDWIEASKGRRVFFEVVPFRSMANSYYWEVAVAALSHSGWSADSQGLLVLAGEHPVGWETYWAGGSGRVVAFK